MKTRNKPHYLIMAAIVAVFAAATWSCNKDDDPSLAELREDKLQYLEDSLRISDSLKRINQSGIVNYAITVVNGSTSTLHKNASGAGRESSTQGLDGAVVTISQYGKTETLTADATGMVVFQGFFRTSVNVNIQKSGFTTADYVIVTNLKDATANNTISFVGNVLPVFETAGANTATIAGKATIQTNLTNKTRELAPDGTKITATINAKDATFGTKFLTTGLANLPPVAVTNSILYAGEIVDAAYSALATGSVTGGNYSITVPSAADGLPILLEYSEVAADQTLFENTSAAGQRTVIQRTVFNENSSSSAPLAVLPTSSNVTVTFESFKTGSAATANAVISANTGAIDRINITDGGSGYVGTPVVDITGGGGTGATATATVGANGRVTGITITSAGTGYTSAPTVTLVSGTTAAASTTLAVNGTVTGVSIANSGFGYTSAPTVTFSAPGGTGTTATGTATIDASGRVIGVTITAGGSGYAAAPTVAFSAAPAGGTNATGTGIYSGQSVASVTVGTAGINYTYAPAVVFSEPQIKTGVRATGTAQIDASTRQVTGIIITNAGSGYTSAPTVTMSTGSGATAQSFLAGGSVISFNITLAGEDYAYAPRVEIVGGNGTGAAGTAVLSGGRVVGINLTSGGTGYTTAPTVNLISGTGAVAYASVTNGAISALTVTDGGHDFFGAPRVKITSTDGGAATATATVNAAGQITALTVGNAGSGYLEGNTPGAEERFSAVKGTGLVAKTGISYVNDVYYGTGAVRNPN